MGHQGKKIFEPNFNELKDIPLTKRQKTEINICLTCEKKKCKGECSKVRGLKKERNGDKKTS